MKFECITCVRLAGTGKVSGKAYNVLSVGGLMQTARGFEMVELMLDGDQPEPKRGQLYEVELSFYPNREKKLSLKVEALRPVVAAAKAA